MQVRKESKTKNNVKREMGRKIMKCTNREGVVPMGGGGGGGGDTLGPWNPPAAGVGAGAAGELQGPNRSPPPPHPAPMGTTPSHFCSPLSRFTFWGVQPLSDFTFLICTKQSPVQKNGSSYCGYIKKAFALVNYTAPILLVFASM